MLPGRSRRAVQSTLSSRLRNLVPDSSLTSHSISPTVFPGVITRASARSFAVHTGRKKLMERLMVVNDSYVLRRRTPFPWQHQPRRIAVGRVACPWDSHAAALRSIQPRPDRFRSLPHRTRSAERWAAWKCAFLTNGCVIVARPACRFQPR